LWHPARHDANLRLARYFNTSAAFWVNLQWRYELELAEDRSGAKIARGVQPLEPANGQ